jgi:hypothetical protein
VDELLCIRVIPLLPLLREIHRLLKRAGRCFRSALHFACNVGRPHTSKFLCLLDVKVFTLDSPRPYYSLHLAAWSAFTVDFLWPLLMLNQPIARPVNVSDRIRDPDESSGLRVLFPAGPIEAVLVK